jgi:hypothetical protein
VKMKTVYDRKSVKRSKPIEGMVTANGQQVSCSSLPQDGSPCPGETSQYVH